MGGFRAHPQQGKRRKELHQLGGNLLNRLVSREPRSQPAELRQVYQTWPGRLGCPRELGPEQIERPSERLRTLAVNKAQDQITAP
jgi:hypothetical protein